MKAKKEVEIVVVGAGIAGIATAFYLSVEHKNSSVLLVDREQPMSVTSAQSGDNYRNWWPHPSMTDFTNDSIRLMEKIAVETSNVINLTRRGYALATRRENIDTLVADLHTGYRTDRSIREHTTSLMGSYQPALSPDWEAAPEGVDIIRNRDLIRKIFPTYDHSITNVIHIRRAGDFSGQQLGQYMLEQIKISGGKRLTGEVVAIEKNGGYTLDVESRSGLERIRADVVVNAAGPFANELAQMMGVELPIENLFHQKIAFEDTKGVIPRALPFAIDLDENELEWSPEEHDSLAQDPELSWLTKKIGSGTHCRPEGGDGSAWVKLGWAYNAAISEEPKRNLLEEPCYNSQFPEIVMRGAARLQPALKAYIGDFPKRWSHYGGYYSMTKENWPLIGPMGVHDTFIVGALSGYGSMGACAAGSLAARMILGKPLPSYAEPLSLSRYQDAALMAEFAKTSNRGVL